MQQQVASEAEQLNLNDSRYFEIKIKTITYLCEQLLIPNTLRFKFKIGTKHSHATFKLKDQQLQHQHHNRILLPIQKPQWKEESHIFMYGAEDFLNLYIEEYTPKTQKELEKQRHNGDQSDHENIHIGNQKNKPKKQQDQNKKSKPIIGNQFIAFSRMLLTPLAQYANTKHTVTVQFIGLDHALKINKTEAVATVQLEIFYKLDFKGKLTIVPMSAHLQRTVAQIGEMKPVIRFKLLQKLEKQQELQIVEKEQQTQPAEGGIHPRWQGHFHFKKDQHNTFQKTEKDLRRYEFDLTSAGRYMQIDILAYPLIGFQADVVGRALLRIEDAGFLKYPRQGQTFQTKQIRLTHQIQKETVYAGRLKLEVSFELKSN